MCDVLPLTTAVSNTCDVRSNLTLDESRCLLWPCNAQLQQAEQLAELPEYLKGKAAFTQRVVNKKTEDRGVTLFLLSRKVAVKSISTLYCFVLPCC